MSDRRREEIKIYKIRGSIFLKNNPLCGACVPIRNHCGKGYGNPTPKKATQIHHKKGRVGKLYLDERFWLQVCPGCHAFAESYGNAAVDIGISIRRNEV